MSTWGDLAAYHDERYQIATGWTFRPGDKIFLGDKENRKCRFCGKLKPEVSFRKEAHALPECIGNKSLFTYYECDSCNQAFGDGCENDFGNWSLPMRTMSRIRGKSGIPTIKQGPNGAWRVEEHPTGLSLSVDETEAFYEDDEANKTLKLHLRRAPYRPVMVVQAITKMALSIMPEREMPNLQQALDWIRPGNTLTRMAAPTPFLYTFISGPLASDIITVAVLTRRTDEIVTPYSVLLLVYGHEMLQMVIPSIEKDRHHYGKRMELRRFPCFRDEGGGAPGNIVSMKLEFDGTDFVRDGSIALDMQYQQKLPR
jgi:hypothetical protein